MIDYKNKMIKVYQDEIENLTKRKDVCLEILNAIDSLRNGD